MEKQKSYAATRAEKFRKLRELLKVKKELKDENDISKEFLAHVSQTKSWKEK